MNELEFKDLHSLACFPVGKIDDGDEVLAGIGKVRYLNDGKGKLRTGSDNQGAQDAVEWVSGGTSRPVPLAVDEVFDLVFLRSGTVDYLAFDRDYLVRPAYFSKDNVDPPVPLVRIGADGKVRRQTFPAAFEPVLRSLERGYSAEMHPIASGHLISVEAPSPDGGGLYRSEGTSLTRIWCTAGQHKEMPVGKGCIATPVRVSPDGCKAAFTTPYASASGNDPLSVEREGTVVLQVLSLCGGGKRK
jgi:hypothetical protein